MFKEAKVFSSFAVDDLARAKRFYAEVLGFDLVESSNGLELRLAGGGRVFVYPKPDHSAASFTVLNIPVKSVESTLGALGERGVRFERYDLPDLKTDDRGIAECDGMKIAWFKDPAGNIVSILEE
jgi:catechol 2,3-dioxygenase-like lactoylglutathione lyase family enzyme